jgi:hypothetical protein
MIKYIKKWWRSQFSEYNRDCNRRCSYGLRGENSLKCKNRINPLKCGRCWRASNLKLEVEHDG